MNGHCQCRKGFSGKFCEIIEQVQSKTNYTQYLKFFLFFIIVTIVIIGLLLGAYCLFKQAAKFRQRQIDNAPRPVPVDEDDIGGQGVDPRGQGNNTGLDAQDRALFN